MTKAEQLDRADEIFERYTDRLARVAAGAAIRGKIRLLPGNPPTIDWDNPSTRTYLERSAEVRKIDAEMRESMEKLVGEVPDDEVMH